MLGWYSEKWKMGMYYECFLTGVAAETFSFLLRNLSFILISNFIYVYIFLLFLTLMVNEECRGAISLANVCVFVSLVYLPVPHTCQTGECFSSK